MTELPTDLEFQLNYKGKIDNQIGRVMGPNTIKDNLVVTGQMYDAEKNMTHVFLDIYRGDYGS